MLLIRYDKSFTSDPEDPRDFSREEFGIKKIKSDFDGELKARVEFPDFGRGPQRRPGFAVEVGQPDVRRYVTAFMEMKHPEALYLLRLIKLAEAIDDAGWHPDEPADIEFDNILPS